MGNILAFSFLVERKPRMCDVTIAYFVTKDSDTITITKETSTENEADENYEMGLADPEEEA